MVDLTLAGEPLSPERFAALLAVRGVQLPVAVCEEPGQVNDAGDRCVLIVDVDRERADHDVEAIALLVVKAINACAGIVPGDGDD